MSRVDETNFGFNMLLKSIREENVQSQEMSLVVISQSYIEIAKSLAVIADSMQKIERLKGDKE